MIFRAIYEDILVMVMRHKIIKKMNNKSIVKAFNTASIPDYEYKTLQREYPGLHYAPYDEYYSASVSSCPNNKKYPKCHSQNGGHAICPLYVTSYCGDVSVCICKYGIPQQLTFDFDFDEG